MVSEQKSAAPDLNAAVTVCLLPASEPVPSIAAARPEEALAGQAVVLLAHTAERIAPPAVGRTAGQLEHRLRLDMGLELRLSLPVQSEEWQYWD